MQNFYPKYINWLLICLLLCVSRPTKAATNGPEFYTIPGTSALTTSHVLDIAKDKTGFMWFATMQGLFRYDGYEVRQYAPTGYTIRSYAGTQKVAVDGEGTLWARLSIGKTCFYDSRNDCLSLSADSLLASRGIQMKAESMLVDNSGDLWQQEGKKLLHYSFAQHKCYTLSCPSTMTNVIRSGSTFFILCKNGYLYKVLGGGCKVVASLPLKAGEESILSADSNGRL